MQLHHGFHAILAVNFFSKILKASEPSFPLYPYGTRVVLEDLKYNVTVLENSMRLLLGEAPGAIERGLFENQELPSDINIRVGVPALLLGKRPDVVAAGLNFRSAFEMTNVARSNFYPSLAVTATGGFQSLELKDWFRTNSLFATVISGLTQPVQTNECGYYFIPGFRRRILRKQSCPDRFFGQLLPIGLWILRVKQKRIYFSRA